MGAAPAADPARLVFSGEIALDPGVKVGDQFVVYLAAVYAPTEKAPVYTKRYETPKFPFRFELTEKDQGFGGTQSDRPLYLRAMISDTGDVMKSRNRTTSETPYTKGTKDIKLTIKP
jgi:hypothetical protein